MRVVRPLKRMTRVWLTKQIGEIVLEMIGLLQMLVFKTNLVSWHVSPKASPVGLVAQVAQCGLG